jgi:HSP20 family molecular chaperone IbpA
MNKFWSVDTKYPLTTWGIAGVNVYSVKPLNIEKRNTMNYDVITLKGINNGEEFTVKLPGYRASDVTVKLLERQLFINAVREGFPNREYSIDLSQDRHDFNQISASIDAGLLKIQVKYRAKIERNIPVISSL